MSPSAQRAFLRGGAREQAPLHAPTNSRPAAAASRSGGTLGTMGGHSSIRLARPRNRPPLQPMVPLSFAGDRSSGGHATPSTISSPANTPDGGGSSSTHSSGQAEHGKATIKVEKCDKCDGNHPTNACPWFKKAREKHPDAKPASEKKMLGMQSGPVEVLRMGNARVIRQPGDGSCLFHSLSHGLRDGSTATALRREVADFILQNPTLEIADSPLKDWVQWDSGSSVSAYCRRMSTGGVWGGGIEMAAVSHMRARHAVGGRRDHGAEVLDDVGMRER